MTKPKLTYFDAPVSRGEECRLALHLAGVDFEDNRISRDQWPAMKPNSPTGGLPILEMPGKPALGQSNAILMFVGRRFGLHPKDDFEAARHDSILEFVEEARSALGATLFMPDDEKKRARERLAATYLPDWGRYAERQISDEGPFFAGAAIHVVDVKLLIFVRWISGGGLDHIPATTFAAYPKLNRVREAVDAHPAIRAWYARH